MRKVLATTVVLVSLAVSYDAQTGIARKIEEFKDLPCNDYLSRMDYIISEAINNPTSTIHIFIYEGKELGKFNSRKNKYDVKAPPVGQAAARIRSMQTYISTIKRFPIDRFVFIGAGYRENLSVEMWLVPNGADPPKATPTLPSMKYRKGKPGGFCIGCC